jgi:hypothetical protein
MDGRVIVNQLDETGKPVSNKIVGRHAQRAHRLSLVPGSTSQFLSVGDDGIMAGYDLREPYVLCVVVIHLLVCWMVCEAYWTGGHSVGAPSVTLATPSTRLMSAPCSQRTSLLVETLRL